MANEEFWKEDSDDDQPYVPPKSKRTAKSKKMQYDGWGSKPLKEFLKEIGKDTEKKISQHELTTIVNDYVSKNNLIKPTKKKRVECDEWLRHLFGKKFVLRIKIHELLFRHLAENRDESSDDEDTTNSEEENGKTASRKRKASVLGNKVTPNSKKVPETLKSCFASVIPENIKLVYLTRKSLLELLKDPETFESKVVGSYVRIKSDPYDYSQKNSHHLLQVTGVRKDIAYGDVSRAYFLQIPHLVKKEIPVCELSNENFKEEECEDLLRRVKAGSANRPTVMELQRKAQTLHEVLTKQWIAKELTLLQNLIDQANEKGWRRELFEYLERKQLLQKPAEQERLLLEVPNVIAEELEPEAIVQEPAEEKNDVSCLPELKILRNRADIPFDGEADKSLSNDDFTSTDGAEQIKSEAIVQEPLADEKNNICSSPKATIAGTLTPIPCDTEANKPEVVLLEPVKDEKNSICCLPPLTIARTPADMPCDTEADKYLPNNDICITNDASAYFLDLNGRRTTQNASDVDGERNRNYNNGTTYVKETNDVYSNGNRTCSNGDTYVKDTNGTSVIELSDDDDEEGQESINDTSQIVDRPESKLWYYIDPQQNIQGPFSMVTLKRWNENLYFDSGFKIWKNGHAPVLLEDMLSLMFPR